MLDRRTFLRKCAFCTGAFAAITQGETPAERTNPSGVGGYGYRLPALPKSSRLLFLGDSITDMKWGRNERARNHYPGHS